MFRFTYLPSVIWTIGAKVCFKVVGKSIFLIRVLTDHGWIQKWSFWSVPKLVNLGGKWQPMVNSYWYLSSLSMPPLMHKFCWDYLRWWFQKVKFSANNFNFIRVRSGWVRLLCRSGSKGRVGHMGHVAPLGTCLEHHRPARGTSGLAGAAQNFQGISHTCQVHHRPAKKEKFEKKQLKKLKIGHHKNNVDKIHQVFEFWV